MGPRLGSLVTQERVQQAANVGGTGPIGRVDLKLGKRQLIVQAVVDQGVRTIHTGWDGGRIDFIALLIHPTQVMVKRYAGGQPVV